MNHSQIASKLFLEGYSCSQAVAMAFSDLTGIDEKTSARMTSAFGGGMGRMREVCGAVSGMLFVLGILYGYDEADDNGGKKELYQNVQSLAAEFKEKNGSIICREILKNPPHDPTPTKRDDGFYATRPCEQMVICAAKLLEKFIEEQALPNEKI